MVWVEAEYVVERLNGAEATRALMLQMAVSSLFSQKGHSAFKKAVKDMLGG